jgi:hypothetical protein
MTQRGHAIYLLYGSQYGRRMTPQVNKAKGTMTNEEFVTLCDLVVKHMEQPGG